MYTFPSSSSSPHYRPSRLPQTTHRPVAPSPCPSSKNAPPAANPRPAPPPETLFPPPASRARRGSRRGRRGLLTRAHRRVRVRRDGDGVPPRQAPQVAHVGGARRPALPRQELGHTRPRLWRRPEGGSEGRAAQRPRGACRAHCGYCKGECWRERVRVRGRSDGLGDRVDCVASSWERSTNSFQQGRGGRRLGKACYHAAW